MSGDNLRFIHAADLHLDRPLHGLLEVPEHLRELLVDAPLQAASRLFETAVLESVDFVLLSGDVLDAQRAGPCLLSFLLDQFEMLAEQRVAVYWCGGGDDPPDAWPEQIALPENVHRFPADQLKAYVHRCGEQPAANILGISHSGRVVPVGEYRFEPSQLFTIAMGCGAAEGGSLGAHKHVDYWALGGTHQPRTVLQGRHTALYPGTPQGRGPEEPGEHGAVLVMQEAGRKVRVRPIAVDAIRWRHETLELGDRADRNALQRALRDGMQRLSAEANGTAVFVSWQVNAAGTLAGSLRNASLNRELVDWLRTEFGRAQTPVWTVSLDVAADNPLPEDLYEEDTILGDFLRAVRDHEEHKSRKLDLAAFLPDLDQRRALATELRRIDEDQRTSLLHAAALLGADLLRGEEPIA